MPCFTRVEIVLDDNELNRRARKKLGLPEEGQLSLLDARRVKVEAGVMKTMQTMQRLNPTAVVRRTGNKLSISVNV